MKEPTVKTLREKEAIKGFISTRISKHFGATSIKGDFQIKNLVDEIVSDIYEEKTLRERFAVTVDHVFDHQMWFFSVVAGYTVLWELKVKLLAEHIGIETRVPITELGKDSKKNRMFEFRELSDIIKDIDKKISPTLNLKLAHFNKLRSAIVHGNLDQLRIIANNKRSNNKETHRGNVFVFDLANVQNGKNLSDQLSLEEKHDQNIFAWIIESTNSKLLEEIWDAFDVSISQLNSIVSFGAYSFDGRIVHFEDVVYRGNKITKTMEEAYDQILRKSTGSDKARFFERWDKLFGKKIFEQ